MGLDWQRLSYASLGVTALWIFMSIRARRGYLAAFRRSIERRDMQPTELRLNVRRPRTVETLVQELAHPEPARVIYAIDMLESLDKRNLVTPLLLYHEAPEVRERTLRALGAGATSRALDAADPPRAVGCRLRRPHRGASRARRPSAMKTRSRTRGRCWPTRTRGFGRPRRSRWPPA